MCVSSEPVAFSNTTIYCAEVLREGKVVHVLGYQNTAARPQPPVSGITFRTVLELRSELKPYPNAMILPIPTNADFGPENVIDGTSPQLKIMLNEYRDCVEEFRPKPDARRSMTKGGDFSDSLILNNYKVFDSGSYTIVVSKTADGLRSGLKDVPENKRPNFPDEIINEYGKLYDNCPIAICCFEVTDKANALEPIYFWYEPSDPDNLFISGLDAHDGHAPKIEMVMRDHTLIFGSYRAEGIRERKILISPVISYIDEKDRWMFTDGIVGTKLHSSTLNGDFIMPLKRVIAADKGHYISGLGDLTVSKILFKNAARETVQAVKDIFS